MVHWGKESAEPEGKAFNLLDHLVTTLTYDREIWVVIKRTRSQIPAAEMGFLCGVTGLSLIYRVKSLALWRELGVEPLLLRIERSQLR